MKKICSLVFVAVVLSSAVFGEKVYSALGSTFSVPMIFEHSSLNEKKASALEFANGFGIHALELYTEKIGSYFSVDFLLPIIVGTSDSDGNFKSYYRKDFSSLWGLSAMLAPTFCFSKTEKMMLAVSPGIHYTVQYRDSGSVFISHLFGLAANFQCNLHFGSGNRFLFGSGSYFMFGADLVYDFLGTTISDWNEYGSAGNLIVSPRIGIGFYR